ncbi:MAG TPA: cellulase family glycosylhydrolase [Methylobacterium sp.]
MRPMLRASLAAREPGSPKAGSAWCSRSLRFGLALCAAWAISAGGIRAQSPEVAPSFVARSGTTFTLDGRPFYVAGVNNHYLAFASRQEVIRVLDNAVAMRANVVRTFIQPVIGSFDGSVPTIWNWKSQAESSNLGVNGNFVMWWDVKESRMAINLGENGLNRLDFVVAEAGKRGLKLIIAFLDFWDYTGGAQQMSAWYGGTDKYTFFAQDPRTRRDYKTWVHYILNRANTITGTTYKADPTIFAWDLMNEPDIHPADLREGWLREMSAYVKALDPNHLVTTGHANMRERLADLAIPSVDFGTWHGYPAYVGMSHEQFDAQIRAYCAIGARHDKPVLLEEFGVARSDPRQAGSYRLWLDTIRAGEACAGWVVWRLVSLQDSGRYPEDTHDQFDIRNDGSETWTVLRDAATALRAKSGPGR